jgi:hypothetical protein
VPVDLKINSWKHMIWLFQAAVLVFGVPFIFSHLLKLPLDLFYVILGIFSIAFIWYYSKATDLDWGKSLSPGWALGIILGAFIGLGFISNASTQIHMADFNMPAFTSRVILRGVIYGVLSAILLTIIPFVITWRAFSGANPGNIRKIAVTLIAVIALASMSFLYNLGLGGFNNKNLNDDVKMSMIANVPSLVSGNPLAGPISNVFLQISRNIALYQENVANVSKINETAKSKTSSGGVN